MSIFSIQRSSYALLKDAFHAWKQIPHREVEGVMVIHQYIMDMMEIHRGGFSPFLTDFYTCKRLNSLEGAMLLTDLNREGFYTLAYLMTHPKNLLNQEGRVKGVGSALVQHGMQLCLKERKEGLILVSNRESERFYEKIGFERGARVNGAQSYVMTSERIVQLSNFKDVV